MPQYLPAIQKREGTHARLMAAHNVVNLRPAFLCILGFNSLKFGLFLVSSFDSFSVACPALVHFLLIYSVMETFFFSYLTAHMKYQISSFWYSSFLPLEQSPQDAGSLSRHYWSLADCRYRRFKASLALTISSKVYLSPATAAPPRASSRLVLEQLGQVR